MNDEMLRKVLDFDALDAAEKITGMSYKESTSAEAFGVGMFLCHTRDKERILLEKDDTTFSNEVGRYLRIAAEEGFRVVLTEAFNNQNETLYILWHDASC